MSELWLSVDDVAKHLSVTKDIVYMGGAYKIMPVHKVRSNAAEGGL